MKLCRVSNGTVIDLETGRFVLRFDKCDTYYPKSNSHYYDEPVAVKEKYPYRIYFCSNEVYKSSDLDEAWRTFEEALKYLKLELSLGSRYLDMRDIFKGADFYTMPENVKPVDMEGIGDGEAV